MFYYMPIENVENSQTGGMRNFPKLFSSSSHLVFKTAKLKIKRAFGVAKPYIPLYIYVVPEHH